MTKLPGAELRDKKGRECQGYRFAKRREKNAQGLRTTKMASHPEE